MYGNVCQLLLTRYAHAAAAVVNRLAPEHSVLSQVQSMFSPALLPWGSRMDSVVDTVMDRNDTALVMT